MSSSVIIRQSKSQFRRNTITFLSSKLSSNFHSSPATKTFILHSHQRLLSKPTKLGFQEHRHLWEGSFDKHVKPENICPICLESAETGKGQAIFTAGCSHSFHFSCIQNNLTHGNYTCPTCHPNDPEPLQFSDDEPLPAPTSDQAADSSSSPVLQNVTLNGIPERPALAASESVDNFAVLVHLKAPSLLADARQSQRAPIDLVLVLDVSGSMYGSKLALLKRAVNFVIDNLGSSDRISVVSFNEEARRILPLSRMTEIGRFP